MMLGAALCLSAAYSGLNWANQGCGSGNGPCAAAGAIPAFFLLSWA